MNRLQKMEREERRWNFARDSGPLLTGVFTRPIYGLVWWWFVSLAFSASIIQNYREGDANPRQWIPFTASVVLPVWILAVLGQKHRRARWLSTRKALEAPLMIKAGIYVIPILCILVSIAVLR